MIVRDVRDEVQGGARVLSAAVRFGAKDPEEHRIHLRRPDLGPPPPGLADPLFATLLISAMALREDLVVEAPVSSALVEAARGRVVPQLLRWHPRLRECAIDAPPAPDPETPGTRTACLFSSGVDSWHSLLHRRGEVAAAVHVIGFEVHHDHRALAEQVRAFVRTVARERRVDLVEVDTSFLAVGLEAVTARLAREDRPWRELGTEAWYGSMLVGVGLALRPRFGRLLVPASWSHDVDYPVASHPLMEPAWSTPSLALEIDGFESTRVEKLRSLAASAPESIPLLRVCVDTSGRVGERMNCGRCIKCVRLWMELRVCGVDPPEALFSRPVDLRRAMRRRFHADPAIWAALEAEADAVGDRVVRNAVQVMRDERLYLPRVWRDLRHALRTRSFAELRWPRRRRAGLGSDTDPAPP